MVNHQLHCPNVINQPHLSILFISYTYTQLVQLPFKVVKLNPAFDYPTVTFSP